MDIHDHISRIQGKLQQLMKQHAVLLKDHDLQKKQLESLQKEKASREEQLDKAL